jgi:hypothetical protein
MPSIVQSLREWIQRHETVANVDRSWRCGYVAAANEVLEWLALLEAEGCGANDWSCVVRTMRSWLVELRAARQRFEEEGPPQRDLWASARLRIEGQRAFLCRAYLCALRLGAEL